MGRRREVRFTTNLARYSVRYTNDRQRPWHATVTPFDPWQGRKYHECPNLTRLLAALERQHAEYTIPDLVVRKLAVLPFGTIRRVRAINLSRQP